MAVEEALYVVEFGDVAGPSFRNGGIVVLDTLCAYGGDNIYYYVGAYTVKDDEVTARLRIVKHLTGEATSAFGDDAKEFNVVIVGRTNEQGLNGTMTRIDKPTFALPVRLILKERLP